MFKQLKIGLVIVADVGPSSGKQSAKGETQAERIKEFLINLIRQKVSSMIFFIQVTIINYH